MATKTKTKSTSSPEKFSFQAEVSKLLYLMVHSVYSEREVFLRELISNASDACDRLRYQALTEPALLGDDPDFRIQVTVDAKARTISVSDNGIGMDRQDLIDHLGTIARSGTSAFVSQLTGDAAKDLSLIGQFGLGFYSAFMVADRVDAIARKAGDEKAWKWSSDGTGDFTIEPAERSGRGTTVILHLREDAEEFLSVERLRTIVKTYSQHIAFPISVGEVKGDEIEAEEIGRGAALWARPPREITPEQYKEFYHLVSHSFDEPWHRLHYRAEGVLEYTVLLYIPSAKPFDLFDPARRPRVRLYVKRVFITDDCDDLLPGYMRFVRGIIDSEDLPLNISREVLQNNAVVAKIRKAVTNRLLAELEKRAADDAESYAKFWENFGAVLKEGLYEDAERRERILKLARFSSTHGDGLTSLADYVSRMKEGQDAIYYITGDDAATVARSPQLEGFAAKGVEVLLLSDPIDDFWLSVVDGFEGTPFRSITRGGADLSKIKGADASEPTDDDDQPSRAALGTLIAALKQNLGDAVKDVRTTERLTDSPVCLVADEADMDLHLQRMLKLHQKLDQVAPRILEINPRHALIRRLADIAGQEGAADRLADVAKLLLDQALILDGEMPSDPGAFSRRLTDVVLNGLD